jgi:hypothetical protein
LGLYRLNAAIVAFEENAGAVGVFCQSEAKSIAGQPGECLDKRYFTHAFKGSEAGDLAIIKAHLTRPPATGGAALAFVEHGHGRNLHG